jgi:Fe-S cluster assembly protein SufD
LKELRERAFARFAEVGFPTTHDEEWLFTNVAPIARANFRMTDDKNRSSVPLLPELGRYADITANPFIALNTAFLGAVTVHRVPAGAVIEAPIEIVHEAVEGTVSHPRTLILVGANAQCSIVETYKGAGHYFTNAVTEIVLGENAVVDHYKVQTESRHAFHVATMQVQVGRSANFSSH